MGKPNGMTPTFQIIRPTGAEDAIWDAVQAAIEHGMTPEDFKREAAEAWGEKLRDEAKHAEKVLRPGRNLVDGPPLKP